ncbi:MAG TPA: hypothetical protein DEB32_02165 [Stenotrophomonas sp.]|uniref:hypothetical protein n=1 Tax=Stenotrophomonas sp. TaxID=69392 RepID=UPI000E84205B|nr:hypothetical protein [Stenotrophomonas sp.]HBS61544.1 hypothetical protein [Stenotrophomonas sp.]
MSTQRIIHMADLSAINSSLRTLGRDLDSLNAQVDAVQHDVGATRSELARLEKAFMDFVAADVKAKELSLAETRQVKIRQELETRFGHYGEVRRQTTGILQAADISLVRQDTIRAASENLMLAAPGYWLAPALVALAAWLNDHKDLAERALAEAIRRGDEKTSLLFALVSRRAGRLAASQQWMDRYLGMQNPVELDRQTVVLIDAIAAGVFGVETALTCVARTSDWIEELSQRAGFIESQRSQWIDALRSKTPHGDDSARYPHLQQYSPTWPALQASLNATATHGAVAQHFQAVFSGEVRATAGLAADVDALLTKLVSHFDVEELPLRRDEELCRLIIEENGDRAAATSRFQLQDPALEHRISFTQLLTNAAMHPETSHASRATQRFATAQSRAWILEAHHDLTASIRLAVPTQVQLHLDGWEGSTTDGGNQADLEAALGQHIDGRLAEALASVKLGIHHWLVMGLGILLMLLALGNIVGMVIAAVMLLWVYMAYRNLDKQRTKVRADFAALREQSQQALKACVAEVVEVRRDLAARDAQSASVAALLESITPDQFTLGGHDNTRRILAATA